MKRKCGHLTVSVVIITRNEASRIQACLESVGWADEIVVVDQFSTDGTAEICQLFGAQVFQRELTRFGEQKQFGVDKASGDWILNVDADERIPISLRDEIMKVIQSGRIDGLAMHIQGEFLGRKFRYQGRFEPPAIRGFRRGRGRFTNSCVDESIVVNGPIAEMSTPLIHERPYHSLTVYLEKLNRYTSLTATDLLEKGVVLRPRNYVWYFGFKPLLVFFHRYFGKQGYREGMRGFLWYVFRAMTYFIAYAKLWEIQQMSHRPPSPPQSEVAK